MLISMLKQWYGSWQSSKAQGLEAWHRCSWHYHCNIYETISEKSAKYFLRETKELLRVLSRSMGGAKVSESLQLILLYLPTAGGNYLHSKMAMMTTKIFGDYISKVCLWSWQRWWWWRWQWQVQNKATMVRVNYHYCCFCWCEAISLWAFNNRLSTNIKRASKLFLSNGLTIFTGRFYIYSLY